MKKVAILIILVILGLNVYPQRSEFGLFLGTSTYSGELNSGMPFDFVQPAGGILFRYSINPHWAFKVSALYGTLMGEDAEVDIFNMSLDRSSDKFYGRNLSFKSYVLDFSPQFEWNMFKYATGSKYGFTPYLFFGVSIFFYNPRAEYEGEWYDLQTLGTEGQGTTAYSGQTPYSLTQIAIPFGFGFKISLSNSVGLGFEYGLRMTFTDYIDDVSTTYADPDVLKAENTEISALLADRSIPAIVNNTGDPRGNESNNDWYTFAGFTLTFKVKVKKPGSSPN